MITALFAICIMIGLYLARNLILHRVFGAIEANVMEASKTYLLIVSASIPFIALYNAGAAVFRTMGNSKVPMYLSMMMNAINVGGNAILIFGFDMGVAGAATSTLVSRVISAVAIILLLCSPEHLLHLERPFSFKLDFGMLKKIAYIGIPNGLENVSAGENHGAEHDYRLWHGGDCGECRFQYHCNLSGASGNVRRHGSDYRLLSLRRGRGL